MALEWVILIGVVAAIVGGGIGYALRSGKPSTRKQIAELEAALTNKDEELSDYRSDVLQQFAQTADKFKSLDESYHALHRQLATSAVALCGDQATPLLGQDLAGSAPSATLDERDVMEIEVTEPAADAEEANSATSSIDESDAKGAVPDAIDAAATDTEEVVAEEIVVSEDVNERPVLTEHTPNDHDEVGEKLREG